MITLYYVEGISSTDTLFFDSLVNQQTFFSNNVVGSLTDGFYPPHYKNEIIVSNDDLKFNKTCNYLSLSYNNKEYYYFIDKVEYISEDVLKLYVTMDVIQTYMFNISFHNSDINRLSISRYVKDGANYLINRRYIRTNRASGTMEQYSITYPYVQIGWYVIILGGNSTLYTGDSTKALFSDAVMAGITNSPISPTATTSLANMIAIPVLLDENYEKLTYGGVTYTRYLNIIRIRMIGAINGVESITYYNYNIFSDYVNVVYDATNKNITLTSKNTNSLHIQRFWNLIDVESGQFADLGYLFVPYAMLNIPYSSDYTPFYQFTRNTSINTPASYYYVPAMIDENYTQLEFGERLGYTTYPLHLLTSTDLYCIGVYNYIDGGRSYYITTDKSSDKYQTLITNTSIEQMPLYNDAWQTYISQNMCTLMRGRALAYQQSVYKAEESAFRFHKKGNRTQKAINYGRLLYETGKDISIYSQSREIQEANIKAQPDNQKVGNSCASDITSGLLRRYIKINRCQDFNDVWKDYEQNGYDVAEHSSENLFTAYKTRYYYNVIRTNSIDIDLKGVIGDSDTIEAISERFNNGLRIWVTVNGVLCASYIGNYTYDNVEIAFIS